MQEGWPAHCALSAEDPSTPSSLSRNEVTHMMQTNIASMSNNVCCSVLELKHFNLQFFSNMPATAVVNHDMLSQLQVEIL